VIVLSAEDVRGALEPAAVVDAVEEVLLQQAAGRVQVPARVTFDVDHGWFRVMPGAVLGGTGRPVMGTKVMALARGGGLSYLLLLYDEPTAELLAMMDASVLTQMRTGAVSASFVRRALPSGAPLVGIFGSGFEARGQLQMIAGSVRVGRVRVYSRDPARRKAFVAEMAAHLGIELEAVGDPRAAAEAPLVVLATRATEPVVDGRWFASGAVVVSIGSTRPELREVDVETIRRAGRILVDHPAQALGESGDIRAALAAGVITDVDVIDVAHVLSSDDTLRARDDRLVLFKPSGTAAQDLAIGRIVYERCLAAGSGRAMDGFLTRKPR
jgi:ornithine cyclodeaminase/alanine dehydrogenase